MFQVEKVHLIDYRNTPHFGLCQSYTNFFNVVEINSPQLGMDYLNFTITNQGDVLFSTHLSNNDFEHKLDILR